MRELATRTLLLGIAVREEHYRILLRPNPKQVLRFIYHAVLVILLVIALRAVVLWTFSVPKSGQVEIDNQALTICMSEQLDLDPIEANSFMRALQTCREQLDLR